jgi:lysophospholipase L1-like esterase
MPIQSQLSAIHFNKKIVFNLLRASFQGGDNSTLAGSQSLPYVENGGPLTVVDSLSLYNITDNKLNRESGAPASNWVDPQIYSQEFTNEAGLLFYVSVAINSTFFSNGTVGASNTIAAAPANVLSTMMAYNELKPYASGSQISTGILPFGNVNATYTIPFEAEIAVISHLPGAFWLHRFKSGMWRLMWVDATTSTTPLRMRFNDLGRPSTINRLGLSNKLPPVYKSRFGISTERIETTINGSILSTEADAFIEHSITAATGVTQEVLVRYVDDNNCWVIRMSQTGSTIKIIERSGGVEIEYASASQTWTDTTQYRISIIVDKYTIRVYVGNTYKCEYVSARSNYEATNAKVSHAGSNLISWPLYLSLDAGTPTISKSVFAVGDSKTAGQGDDDSTSPDGFPSRLVSNLNSSTGIPWAEFPTKIGRSSYGVNYGLGGTVNIKDVIDADLASKPYAPDYVIINLGVNDSANFIGNEAQWVLDYQYIIDTIHVRYPNARISIARVWKAGADALFDSMNDTYIPQVISGRSWCFLGPDERIVLKGDDNGATYTVDGIHPNPAGHQALADAWQTSMGY